MQELVSQLQNLVLEEFAAISLARLLTAVPIACLLGLVIGVIYRVTYAGVLMNTRFILGLVLLSMITCVIILAISANLVLSLGMVGALSIVRFRTAVKDPMDTIFMFWALANGILAGAGFLLIAALATALIGLLFIGLHLTTGLLKRSNAYLMVIRCGVGVGTLSGLDGALKSLPAYQVKSRSIDEKGEELVLELKLSRRQTRIVDTIRAQPGVTSVSLVGCEGGQL